MAAEQGLLQRVTKRLTVLQREYIRSGHVFVYSDSESGIKRWTDGISWSPSRISGMLYIRF